MSNELFFLNGLANLGVSPGHGIEGTVLKMISWLKLGLEIVSALIVIFGAGAALYQVVKLFFSRDHMECYRQLRLVFSRALILALEFQLAADILGTTVMPSWDKIGKLGAIAVIRTFLNYFLEIELKDIERSQGSGEKKKTGEKVEVKGAG